MLLALTFPAIDPVIFELGPIAVRWYSLAYISGLFFGNIISGIFTIDDLSIG